MLKLMLFQKYEVHKWKLSFILFQLLLLYNSLLLLVEGITILYNDVEGSEIMVEF